MVQGDANASNDWGAQLIVVVETEEEENIRVAWVIPDVLCSKLTL